MAGSPTAARQLLEALIEAGVDTFFGVPGGPAAPLFDALLDISQGRLIESRQETAAAFAAASFHAVTGRVPAVLVTSGPGATQVVTGVVSAHVERVPMLIIVADVAWATGGGRLLQDAGPEGIDIENVLRKATRAQIRIARADLAAVQALAALDCAIDPLHPGPVLLVVPMQHASAPVVTVPRIVRTPPARHGRVAADTIAEIADILQASRHPLIVVGGACRQHAPVLQQLVTELGIPVITTPRAKGVIDEGHPLALGHGGLAASGWAREYTSRGIDAALVLGSDLDDVSIGPTPYVASHGRLIHVDLDASVFSRNLPTHLGVVAELTAVAKALRQHWTARDRPPSGIAALVNELKRRTSAYDVDGFATDPRTPIAPHRAIADLQSAMPGATVVTDIGEHMLFALHYAHAGRPEDFSIQLGLGSMGSGIAGAIGIALGRPSKRVLCIAGDGGMQMFGTEVLVALKERLPILFAVFNDGRYNMVHHGMLQQFGRTRAWDTPLTDFTTWARAMAMPAARVDAPGEICPALVAGLLDGGGPALLDIRIDPSVRIRGAGRVEALQRMSMSDRLVQGGRK